MHIETHFSTISIYLNLQIKNFFKMARLLYIFVIEEYLSIKAPEKSQYDEITYEPIWDMLVERRGCLSLSILNFKKKYLI